MKNTILVVDDEIEIREIICSLLESAGHNVITAKDGADALEVVKMGGINCIVSDIRMPRMDGIEFVTKLRMVNARVPVIFCTALCPNLVEEAILDGISNILLKPIDFGVILAKFSGDEK